MSNYHIFIAGSLAQCTEAISKLDRTEDRVIIGSIETLVRVEKLLETVLKDEQVILHIMEADPFVYINKFGFKLGFEISRFLRELEKSTFRFADSGKIKSLVELKIYCRFLRAIWDSNVVYEKRMENLEKEYLKARMSGHKSI